MMVSNYRVHYQENSKLIDHIDFCGANKQQTFKVEEMTEEQKVAVGVNWHLLLYAKNEEGYYNIIKIHNDAQLHGVYEHPRTTNEFISKHGKGVVCVIPSVNGEVINDIENDREKFAIVKYRGYKNIFEEVYLELTIAEDDYYIEENNKVMIYMLGLNENGGLTDILPNVLCENLINYLSEYKMINDFIEMKSGRIINIQFEIDIFVDKNYNTSDVITNVSKKVQEYMDINNREMGDDVFVGDIEKEISKIDGVENLIELRVYNVYNNEYSTTRTTQQIVSYSECVNSEEVDMGNSENRDRIDLKASDKMLFCENDTMLEIKYPSKDIICQVKQR
jgi:hypothetical protein